LTASRARPMRAVDTFVDTAVRVPACGTAIEPTVPPTVPPGFRGGGGRESGPAAGPGTSSRISAGNHSAVEAHDITSTGAWCTPVGWQHEERYRTRGGELRTSLSRSRGHKGYRPAFPRLLYALRSSNPHAMQVFVTAEKIFSSGGLRTGGQSREQRYPEKV